MALPTDINLPAPDQRIAALLARRRGIRFPPDLEQAFCAQYDATSAGSARTSALMVLGVIAVFTWLDLRALPWTYEKAWTVRPWLQVAPALLLASLSRTGLVQRHIQLLTMGSLMLGGLATLLILAQAQPREWGYYLYPYALAQIAALAHTGSRLRFPYAVAVGAYLIAGYAVTALLGQSIPLAGGTVAFALPLFFLLAINVIGAQSCLHAERLLRRNFLQQRLIEQEHARAETLLFNMLPAPIVERLKRQEVVADAYQEASVLFADLTRFTEMTARLPARQLVALLDALFTRFDALAERHGVEKIKTIGDAYMAASGVPVPRPDQVQALARMALDMRAAVSQFRVIEPQLNVRIGIATGPVVAGVIGSKRRIYDLWGDTVNVASRLESSGVAGQIQVDARTHACLQHQFVLTSRGAVVLKGKGECMTYWLRSARPVLPSG